MIRSHVVILIVFSLLVSGVFALLLRDDARSRLRFAALTFGAFLLSVLVAGWLMYPIPD